EERHRAAHDTKVSDGDDVLVTNRGGRKCFLSKARGEHRIVADQIRKNDFYRVRGFEKDVSRLEDDAHAALAETSFEQVARVECRFTQKRRRGLITVLGTVINLIRVAAPTDWTLSHLLGNHRHTD